MPSTEFDGESDAVASSTEQILDGPAGAHGCAHSCPFGGERPDGRGAKKTDAKKTGAKKKPTEGEKTMENAICQCGRTSCLGKEACLRKETCVGKKTCRGKTAEQGKKPAEEKAVATEKKAATGKKPTEAGKKPAAGKKSEVRKKSAEEKTTECGATSDADTSCRTPARKRRKTAPADRRRRRPSEPFLPAGYCHDRVDGFPEDLRGLGVCDEDRFAPLPYFSLAPIMAYYLAEHKDLVLEAYAEYLRRIQVNPQGMARCLGEIDAIHDWFFDWFVYSYKIGNSTTPLAYYLFENQGGMHPLTRERSRALWKVLTNSIEGVFQVDVVSLAANVVVLRGLSSDEEHVVHDRRLARDLFHCPGGYVCGRLTQFEDVWMPTSRLFHIPTPGRKNAIGEARTDIAAFLNVTRHRSRAERLFAQWERRETARREEERRMALRRRRKYPPIEVPGMQEGSGLLGGGLLDSVLSEAGLLDGLKASSIPGCPDEYIPVLVNVINKDWFMANGVFEPAVFRPISGELGAPKVCEGADGEADGAAPERGPNGKGSDDASDRASDGASDGEVGKAPDGKAPDGAQTGKKRKTRKVMRTAAGESWECVDSPSSGDSLGVPTIPTLFPESAGYESFYGLPKKRRSRSRGLGSRIRKATAKGDSIRSRYVGGPSSQSDGRGDDGAAGVDLLGIEVPLSRCRKTHGFLWDISEVLLESMQFPEVLRLVFSGTPDGEYDADAHGARDYVMLCQMLSELGIQV